MEQMFLLFLGAGDIREKGEWKCGRWVVISVSVGWGGGGCYLFMSMSAGGGGIVISTAPGHVLRFCVILEVGLSLHKSQFF